jgi:hypothetical protein
LQHQVNTAVPSGRGGTPRFVLPTTSVLGVDDEPIYETPSREKPDTDPLSRFAKRRSNSASKTDDTSKLWTSDITTSTTGDPRKASNAFGPPPGQGQRKEDAFELTIKTNYDSSGLDYVPHTARVVPKHRRVLSNELHVSRANYENVGGPVTITTPVPENGATTTTHLPIPYGILTASTFSNSSLQPAHVWSNADSRLVNSLL